jgi:hypothetical protein
VHGATFTMCTKRRDCAWSCDLSSVSVRMTPMIALCIRLVASRPFRFNGGAENLIELSSTTFATMPGGRLLRIWRNFSRTAVATVRLFSPVSISAVPITTSRPFLLAAPVRNPPPILTFATSLMVMGTLPRVAMTARLDNGARRPWQKGR